MKRTIHSTIIRQFNRVAILCIALAHMLDARCNPVTSQLACQRHFVSHAGRFGTVDHEQIRKSGNHHAEVTRETVAPDLLQRDPVTTSRV